MYVSLIANLIGQCLDYLERIPEFSRQNMFESLTQSDQGQEKVSLQGIFDENKAIIDLREDTAHPLVPQIIELLDIIESSAELQNQGDNSDYGKLEQMLKQKMNILADIQDFERKQKWMLYGTLSFIFVWIVFFYVCYARQQSKKAEAKLKISPEEREAQRKTVEEGMRKLDIDILRAEQILKQLKTIRN